MEAGYRCAIPVCRNHPAEVDHIDDWATVKEHRFENLIALCPTCHARKGNKPGQIDRKALRGYKANLGRLNMLYGDMERRMLEEFAERRSAGEPVGEIRIPFYLSFMVSNLVKDGYLHIVTESFGAVFSGPTPIGYGLTEAGIALVDAMIAAEPVGGGNEGADIPEFPE
ncbi:HNH endonuclease signature motif containing protein [Micromonospora echinofusca]|uniref:HNH endonuclease signature motif containing protein n=1 Tax=Micromonospora echinofusca TaxID=47858 RepID=UPI0033E471AA